MKRAAICCIFLSIALLAASGPARATTSAEERVLDYVRTHLQPGQPLMVTDLYNRVFTQPDERQALNKLYNAFFRIPLFVANYQEKYKKPPTLAVIAQQFDLHSAADADVLLRVMESDPRVPQFLIRDPKTGEITHVDVDRIKSDPKFGQALARQIGGWKDARSRCFADAAWGGSLNIADFRGRLFSSKSGLPAAHPACRKRLRSFLSTGSSARADSSLSAPMLTKFWGSITTIPSASGTCSNTRLPIPSPSGAAKPTSLRRHFHFPHHLLDRPQRRRARPLDWLRHAGNFTTIHNDCLG